VRRGGGKVKEVGEGLTSYLLYVQVIPHSCVQHVAELHVDKHPGGRHSMAKKRTQNKIKATKAGV
jgi:hypothetical protein